MEDKNNLPIVEYYKDELKEREQDIINLDGGLLYMCFQTKRLMSEVASITKHERINKKLYVDVVDDLFRTWIYQVQHLTMQLDRPHLSLHHFLRDQKQLYDKRNGDFDLLRHKCLVCECIAYDLEIPLDPDENEIQHSGDDERCPGNEDLEALPEKDRCHCSTCMKRPSNIVNCHFNQKCDDDDHYHKATRKR